MGSLKAVVVDDNRLNRQMVAKTLQSNGVEVREAENATDGWRAILETSPQLAVLDIMMPGEMDGVDLCRLIKSHKNHEKTAVVMITAAEKKREAERAFAAGADLLLPKPFLPKEMWRQVSALLNRGSKTEKPMRVLLVDDDRDQSSRAEQALAKGGFTVSVQTETRGAFRGIKSFRPDCVILNTAMADMTGIDFTGLIKNDATLSPTPKVLLYSELAENETAGKSGGSSADGFLSRHSAPDQIVYSVKKVLGQA